MSDISKLFVPFSNGSRPCNGQKTDSRSFIGKFCNQVLWIEKIDVFDCVALPSSEVSVSLSEEGIESIVLNNPEGSYSEAILIQKYMKCIARGHMEYVELDESFCFQ